MAKSSANINSPDVLKHIRVQMIGFEKRASQAISDVRADLQRTRQWLHHDQMRNWKIQLKKMDELVREARSKYLMARHDTGYSKTPSYIEEERALKKLERRKEEIEARMVATKKWARIVDDKAEKLLGPITNLANVLENVTPRALSRLDVMVRNLEEYLRANPIAEGGTSVGVDDIEDIDDVDSVEQ